VGPGAAVSLALADLTERERESVTRALWRRGCGARSIPERARSCARAGLARRVVERDLLVRVAALAGDRSEAARAAALDLLDLLDLAGRAVPFDAQTAFDRVRAALPADEARSLCSLARRLGFAVAI